MQYTYLIGVLIILFFGFMYLSEKLWLKNQPVKPPAQPEPRINPAPQRPREPAREKERSRKKGRRR
jgi:hypothetical protein